MIREYRIDDKSALEELGNYLKPSFNINNISSNEKILVYEEDGKILGFIDYITLYENTDILYIVVNQNYRKKGIGTLLLNEMIKRENCKHIMLEVKETNIDAIKFYETNNFKTIRIIKNYYENIDAYAMERSIQ